MVLVHLRFAAGRYHATPWGRHVNEGAPEWPPSPYRLLRALFDAWKRKRPAWPEAWVGPLLEALAASPPSFWLPPATVSHTRAFLSSNAKDVRAKQLVFDPFVVVSPRDPVVVGWPQLDLDGAARATLDELLGLLSFLGRSESWVEACVPLDQGHDRWNCRSGEAPSAGEQALVVACPVPPAAYAARPYEAPARGKRKAHAVPWLEALTWSTDQLVDSKRSEPPALRFVPYTLPATCFAVTPSPRPARRPRVQGVLFALQGAVLPQVTTAVEVAERARRRLMGIHARLAGSPAAVSPRFSGKGRDGKPLTGHPHAYILPIDADADGRLDHLLVVCRVGDLDELEHDALERLPGVWQRGGRGDLRCVPVRWGTVEELLVPSRRLRSATPFIPPRHYRRGRGGLASWLAAEVAREAENHGLPRPVRVTPVARLDRGAHHYRWLEFRRSRKGETPRLGFGFELEFAEPVLGPAALGYGAHFGLGLFLPSG